MKIRLLIPVITRRYNTEEDHELFLQKEYESDFVPRKGDKIAIDINEVDYKIVSEVMVFPFQNEIEIRLSSIGTQATNIEELTHKTNMLAVNGWSLKDNN